MLGVAQTKSTATIIKTIFVQTQRMQNGPKKTVQTIANCAVSCTKTFLLKKVFRKECTFKIDLTVFMTQRHKMAMGMF